MAAKYAVGIDLGTTNSVLAFAVIGEESPKVELLLIPQLVAPGIIEQRGVLPSFIYLGTDADTAAGSLDVPWKKKRDFGVGEMARLQAAQTPARTVAAAKSWLTHTRVDRHQPILPWGAPDDIAKVSPVEAATRYLAHLAAAWKQAFPKDPIAEQRLVLTLPASFDAAARDLTRQAAVAAGLGDDITLLEEPQAAVYAWLADRGSQWRRQLKLNDRLLVVDVGGGTTDFTLIDVAEENGELILRRAAVGNHTLVGGDNMDLALAHRAQQAFADKGVNIDAWQSVSLWHSCRAAKEALLAPEGPAKHPVAILGRGSKLVGGAVSVDLDRKEIADFLVDGFFPMCSAADHPARRAASGFREIGLPYEADTAITRHLAAFLASQGKESPRPTHVLFNGGVFKATRFQDRLLEILSGWQGEGTPARLEGLHDLDYAVARGAAYYAAAKSGQGVRIRGGTTRSYYVGIETSGPAIPGAPRPLRALCVVPLGMEEGTEADVPGGEIGLVVGEPAQFRFFSSAVRKADKPGDLIERWTEGDDLSETDSMQANLPAAKNSEDGWVPVTFQSRITELGVFELWCVSAAASERWKLEFSVREDADKSV